MMKDIEIFLKISELQSAVDWAKDKYHEWYVRNGQPIANIQESEEGMRLYLAKQQAHHDLDSFMKEYAPPGTILRRRPGVADEFVKGAD